MLLDWFSPLLRIVCRKMVKESDLKWVPMKGRNNVKMLFVHDPQGFTSCGSILKKALPHQKIDVLIVDSDYGIKEEPWDKVAWSREFGQANNFVYNHNQTLRDVNFFFFLSDKQLMSALSVVVNQGLSYRLVTWSKRRLWSPRNGGKIPDDN